jgi:hypothetical protein
MPGDFGDLAVNTRVHFYHHHAHTRLRVRLAPGIPHALFLQGEEFLAWLGRNAPRECGGVFDGNARNIPGVITRESG